LLYRSHTSFTTGLKTIMKLIIKTLLGIFVLSLVVVTTVVMISDVEIIQQSVVKTVPNEKILVE